MEKKKVLYVVQEMEPYLNETSIGDIVKKIAPYAFDNGVDVRILMPRFGVINERRNRLHEVVRLSGMNIIIDDDDYPLIIKVASLPGSRIQIYFMDNDDFFKRKFVYHNEEGTFYDDNHERMVFFCKSIFETVRKFGWAPDIIHCHGWFTSLVPLFAKTTYLKDPVFCNSKVIFSVYNDTITENMPNDFAKKATISADISSDMLEVFGDFSTKSLNRGGAHYADAIIQGDNNIDWIDDIFSKNDKPKFANIDANEINTQYLYFYNTLMQ